MSVPATTPAESAFFAVFPLIAWRFASFAPSGLTTGATQLRSNGLHPGPAGFNRIAASLYGFPSLFSVFSPLRATSCFVVAVLVTWFTHFLPPFGFLLCSSLNLWKPRR
jgi:hypothetical protein